MEADISISPDIHQFMPVYCSLQFCWFQLLSILFRKPSGIQCKGQAGPLRMAADGVPQAILDDICPCGHLLWRDLIKFYYQQRNILISVPTCAVILIPHIICRGDGHTFIVTVYPARKERYIPHNRRNTRLWMPRLPFSPHRRSPLEWQEGAG